MDDWQQWVLRESLGERPDHTWSAFECALVVGRQNGKNAILEARELAGIVLFGDDLITHTAHRADTTLEHFRRMERYAEEFDELAKLVKHISHKNGDESIELKGNRRIRFVSRARQPGRGFSGSCVVFDEALYLAASAIGAIVPTLATRPMAQVWYTSSAPKADSMNLHAVIKRGRGDEEDDRLFFAEWGNEHDADRDDIEALYRANPGLGIRITEEYVKAERKLMSGDPELEAEYNRERLGIPEMPASDGTDGPIDLAKWSSLLDADSLPAPGSERIALDAPQDRTSAVFAVAGKRPDGLAHVSVHTRVEKAGGLLRDQVIKWALEIQAKHKTPIILPPSSPAKAWRTELLAAGVELDELSGAEFAEACGAMSSLVDDGAIRHRGQADMTEAVAGLAVKPSGDVDVWSARKSSVSIAPFRAATCALVRVARVEPANSFVSMILGG